MSRATKQPVGATRLHPRSMRLSPLVWLLALGACTSVLGIEDLQEGPRPGSGGEPAMGGKGGGGRANGGSSSPAGGAVDPAAGQGNVPSGGAGGAIGIGGAGNDAGGSGAPGDAGAAGQGIIPDDPTVRGHLIDAYGHKLPNVPVQIGDTLVSTDQDGAFVIPNVAANYDVSLAIEYEQGGGLRTYGWVFQGLTRRDPTLQVRRGLPVRYGDIVVTPKNAKLAAGQTISVAVGGPDGNSQLDDVGINGVETSAAWEGAGTTQATAHGLHFQRDVNELPTSYLSYNTSLALLSESGGKTQISLDLAKVTVDAGQLKGTVTPGGGMDRANQAFLRFDSGAALQLVDDSAGPNSFTYLLPSIAKSTLTVAASEGDAYFGAYAVAHADGLAVTSKPVLKIPTPATLTGPASLATATSATKFSFQSPASNPGPFVVSFENVDFYQELYVVTASKQLTIPVVTGGGFELSRDQQIAWRVETNGKFASVDAMAGPQGFLDSFDRYGFEGGIKTESGEYTISSSRLFKLAP